MTKTDATASETDTLSTTVSYDTIGVRDAEGGTWWPSEEATAQIEAAEDPHAEAIRICREQPMRGEWIS